MMKKPSVLDWIAMIIVFIGGLNWGLVGLLNLNLVSAIFGDMSVVSKVVYILVGLSAIYVFVKFISCCKKCDHQA